MNSLFRAPGNKTLSFRSDTITTKQNNHCLTFPLLVLMQHFYVPAMLVLLLVMPAKRSGPELLSSRPCHPIDAVQNEVPL